jgi:hypothetical protein
MLKNRIYKLMLAVLFGYEMWSPTVREECK